MSLYEKFTFRGRTLDRMTIAALLCTEKALGYPLTVVQGSYNRGGVSASAGTHDGGGAVDLVWFDIKRKNRKLRGVGKFAGWPRPANSSWGDHWHGILIGNERASSGAKVQVVEYRNGFDGLAGSGRDVWWRPGRIRPFSYRRAHPLSWKRVNGIARHKGVPWAPEGARQVEVVARALAGFNMDMRGHRKGRMDRPLLEALKRFKRHRDIDDKDAPQPLNAKTCYALCIPTREAD